MLCEVIPGAAIIGLLIEVTNINLESVIADVERAARLLGKNAIVAKAGNERDIDAAFAKFREQGVDAIMLSSGALFTQRREQIVVLAARHGIPTMSARREYVTAGGLMGYGTDLGDSYRQAGIYTGRILKGEKAAELPVLQPTKFEFVINLKTAKALGLEIPPAVRAIADEVIE